MQGELLSDDEEGGSSGSGCESVDEYASLLGTLKVLEGTGASIVASVEKG